MMRCRQAGRAFKLTMGWVMIRLTLGGILDAAAARRAPDWQAAGLAQQSGCLLGHEGWLVVAGESLNSDGEAGGPLLRLECRGATRQWGNLWRLGAVSLRSRPSDHCFESSGPSADALHSPNARSACRGARCPPPSALPSAVPRGFVVHSKVKLPAPAFALCALPPFHRPPPARPVAQARHWRPARRWLHWPGPPVAPGPWRHERARRTAAQHDARPGRHGRGARGAAADPHPRLPAARLPGVQLPDGAVRPAVRAGLWHGHVGARPGAHEGGLPGLRWVAGVKPGREAG